MKSPISPGRDRFVVPDHLPTATPNHGADTALVAGTGRNCEQEKQFDPFPLTSRSRTASALVIAMCFAESRESFVALIGYRKEKV